MRGGVTDAGQQTNIEDRATQPMEALSTFCLTQPVVNSGRLDTTDDVDCALSWGLTPRSAPTSIARVVDHRRQIKISTNPSLIGF